MEQAVIPFSSNLGLECVCCEYIAFCEHFYKFKYYFVWNRQADKVSNLFIFPTYGVEVPMNIFCIVIDVYVVFVDNN